jgi:hypothetical protein
MTRQDPALGCGSDKRPENPAAQRKFLFYTHLVTFCEEDMSPLLLLLSYYSLIWLSSPSALLLSVLLKELSAFFNYALSEFACHLSVLKANSLGGGDRHGDRTVGKWGSSDTLVSRPLLRLMYGEYWFRLSRLSMLVIGSFASYTKTKSVESAVWCLLTLDDDVETVAGNLLYGIEIPEQSSGSELLFSLLNNNQNKTQMKM